MARKGFVSRFFPGDDDYDDFYEDFDEELDDDDEEEKTPPKKGAKPMRPEDYRKLRGRPADDDPATKPVDPAKPVAPKPAPAATKDKPDTTPPKPVDCTTRVIPDLDEKDVPKRAPVVDPKKDADDFYDFFGDDDDDDDDDDGDDAFEYLERRFDAQDATLRNLLDAVATLNKSVNTLTTAVSKLPTTAPLPTIAKVDLEPLKKLIGEIPAETAKLMPKASAPDLTPVLDAIKTIKPVSVPSGSAPAMSLEDVIDRDLDVQAFKREVEGFEFRKVYDLNGTPKTPEEVKTFFGSSDPTSHGLTLRVAKFAKGKFVAWSDARHLRAYELSQKPTATPKSAPKPATAAKKPADAAPALDPDPIV